MSGTEAAVAIFLLIAFIGGAVLGVVAIVSVASRREDRLHSLTGEAPDAVCRGTRRLIGAGTRGGWPASPAPGQHSDALGREADR
ncbi:MAG TPA: hypothetical protein VKV38_00540 [Trebonia sp.]|nr:hypothetical protein [Trebonia sp.]